MKLNFKYDREKDVWCLLNKGPSSNNSSNSTKIYKELVSKMGENPTKEDVSKFIDGYLKNKNYNVKEYIESYQKQSDSIIDEFTKIAERVFGISLSVNIIAYLTVNSRCPYNIENRYFYVTILNKPEFNPNPVIFHELWHFYTWHKFGSEKEKLGDKKYNELKEALTVLLNIECKELIPRGFVDVGYPQHKELRNKILKLWEKDQDIDVLWKELAR